MKSSRHKAANVSDKTLSTVFVLRPTVALAMSAFMAMSGIGVSTQALANQQDKSVEFDTTFLQFDAQQHVDVSRFERGNFVSPSVYSVDIWMNDKARDARRRAFCRACCGRQRNALPH
ncbi:FimD/PapC N-terminal domain-containing protein [Candidatus Burkholderia verschuerenii]|uniref:FimD/PapC N-terminal domain-containing protein n=1 Tax=Candidatus Burkholderia verschuerenii TaxID=242163 RepID=UPI000AE79DE2|nr:FimD/PapC N-terminal domain-containing protein [Candidatus Burkholderia verschuerenii]